MRQFACDSGSTIAQFAMYHPYPGTKDFYEMIRDSTNRAKIDFTFTPKHATQISGERFWLKPKNEADLITHGIIPRDELFAEHKKCWDKFYSLKAVSYTHLDVYKRQHVERRHARREQSHRP